MPRQEVVLKSCPVNEMRFSKGINIQIPSNGTIYLVVNPKDHFQKTWVQALAREFETQGMKTRTLEYNSHVSFPDSVPDLPDAAGLLLVQPGLEDADHEKALKFLEFSFCLMQKNAGHLMASAEKKGGFLASISFLGGGFGFDNGPFPCSAVYGGLAGLVKTASLEWKQVLCRAIDLSFDWSPDMKKNTGIVQDTAFLSMVPGPVEMGLTKNLCRIPELVSREISSDIDTLQLKLCSDDVVCITGGARGVTAQCAIALARQTSCSMILLGRSRAPFEPPVWARGITHAGELKKRILANEFAHKKPSLAQLEQRYRELAANGEILDTLEQIRSQGSRAAYFSCDVTDTKAVACLFNQIGEEFGPVSAIIHGAGVIHDKQIAEKTLEQFRQVLSTKVNGLCALMAAAETLPVKYLVLFSSVAARTGNPGQCDYAAANEVLNKMTWDYARKHPDCTALSINWGPWDGGMVTESLKKNFQKRGIDLIPLHAGAEQLVREMAHAGNSLQREVVLGPHLTGTHLPDSSSRENRQHASMTRVMTRKCSLEHLPILHSHIIDHVPVIPFALIAEWLFCAAEKNNPGLLCTNVRNLRLFKGIRLTEQDMGVQVYVSSCVLQDGELTCQAELRSRRDQTGKPIVHAAATCILEEKFPLAPVLPEDLQVPLEPSEMTASQAYETVLFHGKGLQCITKICGISSRGIEVEICQDGLSDSEKWDGSSHDWKTNPLMVDAGFQAVILWCHHHTSQVCLPGFAGQFKRYAHPVHDGPVRVMFTVTEHSRLQIRGYITFFNENKEPVAAITGFEAIVDPGLQEKFKPLALRNRDQILEFAQGKPSQAFGSRYEIFDSQRQIARLPRPPYFFMDEVLLADHPQWVMKPGGWVRSRYQVPRDAWYFGANHTQTMPFCILLEIALQPCGWLAAWAGSALHSEDRLHFRNLGGRAKLFSPIFQDAGDLTISCRMTEVSHAGGMIIQNFDMEVASDTELLYQGTTNFGFFTAKALANQVGIKDSPYCANTPQPPKTPFMVFGKDDAPVDPHDTEKDVDMGMPAKALRMIDAVDVLEPEGGIYGKGYIQAHKMVDPDEWFFQAHFYQDPVCPGSLGIESFLQMLRFFLREQYKIDPETYQAIMTPGQTHEWMYRGQIIPASKKVMIHAHVSTCRKTDTGYEICADGALAVDGITIYEMKEFSLQFVSCESFSRTRKDQEVLEEKFS